MKVIVWIIAAVAFGIVSNMDYEDDQIAHGVVQVAQK